MDLLTLLLSVLLFAAASNLDTLILALSWGLRGGRLSIPQCAVLSGVTTAVTACALTVGRLAGRTVSGIAKLGPLVLVAMGLWTLLDWLRCLDRRDDQPQPPEGLAGCFPLAGALAVNNAGMGAAAGASGLSPLWAAVGNLAVTLTALALGCALGRRAEGRGWGKFALPLSGVLLMVLGLVEMG